MSMPVFKKAKVIMKNNNIHFAESDLDNCSTYLEQYKQQIAIPYDDFLEFFIIESKIFLIEMDHQACGFFGIYQKRLTILYIDDQHFVHGNQILDKIKNRHEIEDAFIPTTDIAALSLVLESYTEIKIQALHFSDTGREVRPAEFGKEYFRLAEMSDLQEIQEIAEDFLDNYAEKIKAKELYVLEKDLEILGIGVLERNKIMDNCIGTGMLTKESQRGRGVGRSIILHLKEIVHEMGMTPVPGCWYYNINSRKTLESAGYITKSKLLHIIF